MNPKEGLYEKLINQELAQLLVTLEKNLKIQTEPLKKGESTRMLMKYIDEICQQILIQIAQESEEKQQIAEQIHFCNEIVQLIGNRINSQEIANKGISLNPEILLSIMRTAQNVAFPRPNSSIQFNSLFTGTNIAEPKLYTELKTEIMSADRVDLLVSFIRWSGLRLIIEDLKKLTESGRVLRIITTTYLGATELKAIRHLADLPNTQIHISYDVKSTRLHAKSYLFYRESGYGTVYIGSSNMSKNAFDDGMEWNVKICQQDSTAIFEKCIGTFESYLKNSAFSLYTNTQEEQDKLKTALQLAKTSDDPQQQTSMDREMYFFDISPYAYQKEILDQLDAERRLHARYKNLVVAATGTGKTVIAAFDYRRFREEQQKNGKTARLLFIAHREEILQQSRDCFRRVLKQNQFGTLWVGRHQPTEARITDLFVSIQTFNARELHEMYPVDYFDFLIIDEFHHAAAASYQEILTTLRPKILLGLTATPERMDQKSIVDDYFDGHMAAELRLSEAINRGLLSPFHYFIVDDPISLELVTWNLTHGFDRDMLEQKYIEQDVEQKRIRAIIQAIETYMGDLSDVRAIGFCVTVKHAQYMADTFNALTQANPALKLRSICLHAGSSSEERITVKMKLERGELQFVFVVDLYNEGIDIPSINSVLFLRPTDSLTVFLQQLGRGLRLEKNKSCLTVLDFVAQANNQFNYIEKYLKLLNKTNRSLKDQVELNFPDVPLGCYIQMEERPQQLILNQIKSQYMRMDFFIRKVKEFKENHTESLTLTKFIEIYHLNVLDLYRRSREKIGWYRLLEQASIIKNLDASNPIYQDIIRNVGRFTFMDSLKLLDFSEHVIQAVKNHKAWPLTTWNEEEQLLFTMFYYTLWNKDLSELQLRRDHLYHLLEQNPLLVDEILEVISLQKEKLDHISPAHELPYVCPLEVHCQYFLDQILAAFGIHTVEQKAQMREGVKYLPDKQTDLFFITIDKTEKEYSPSTLYQDYAIDASTFHWQSQSTTADTSPTGQRYLRNNPDEVKLLFVRKQKQDFGGVTLPYHFLGPAYYYRHSGSKPISIEWHLKSETPSFILMKTSQFINAIQ